MRTRERSFSILTNMYLDKLVLIDSYLSFRDEFILEFLRALAHSGSIVPTNICIHFTAW